MPIPRRLRSGGAEAGWVAIGQGLAFLGTFAAIKLLTDKLGPAEYGWLALGMSAAGILHMFLYGPVEQTALRYLSVFRERQELGLLMFLLRRVHVILFLAIVLVAAGLAAVCLFLGNIRWGILVASAAILGVFSGINSTLGSLQTAMRLRRPVAIFQAGEVWLRLFMALLVMAVLGTGATSALIGFSTAAAIILLAQILLLRKHPDLASSLEAISFDEEVKRKRREELFAYGLPYVSFAAFAWLGTYADRWLLMLFADENAVGIYAAMIQIANAPVALFIGMTNQYLVPLIFDRAGSATSKSQLSSSARLLGYAIMIYGLVLSVILLAIGLYAEPLVLLVTNAEFARYADMLWILCAALGLASMGQLLVLQGLSQSSSSQYIWPKFIQVAALFATGLMVVPSLGLRGMCIALLVSSLTYLAAVFIVNQRRTA